MGSSGGQGGKTGLYVVGYVGAGGQRGRVFDTSGIVGCLTATEYKDPQKILVRPILTPNRINKRQNGRRIKEPGENMFTITASEVHGVAIKEATVKEYSEAYISDSINLSFPSSKTRGDIVGKSLANTLGTNCSQSVVTNGYRVRRLTPLECFRLQGFPDECFYKAKNAGLSDTRLYKCAGNSVTVNVVYELAKRLN